MLNLNLNINVYIDYDINLLSRGYRWPQDIEAFLELATNRVIQKKAEVEAQLKIKKAQFEIE